VVVLLILSVVLALTAPTIRTGKPRAESALAALVRTARATAIQRGEVVELDIGPSGGWRLSGLGGSSNDLITGGRVDYQGAELRLVFSPHGMCTPAIGAPAAEALPLDLLQCEVVTP
jgi:Tfp pilus assembly protein FimT